MDNSVQQLINHPSNTREFVTVLLVNRKNKSPVNVDFSFLRGQIVSMYIVYIVVVKLVSL